MVKRRKVLFGIGALAAGGAAATATGAFSAAEMNRNADINVVTDDNGLVALTPNDEYSEVFLDGGELKIDFSTDEGAEGVNVNSRYQVGNMWINNANVDGVDGMLSDPSKSPGNDPAFEIVNQDTTEHDLTLTYEASGENSGSVVYMQAGKKDNYDSAAELTVGQENLTDSIQVDDLGSGEKFGVSILVDTRDGSVGDGIGGTLTVTAD